MSSRLLVKGFFKILLLLLLIKWLPACSGSDCIEPSTLVGDLTTTSVKVYPINPDVVANFDVNTGTGGLLEDQATQDDARAKWIPATLTGDDGRSNGNVVIQAGAKMQISASGSIILKGNVATAKVLASDSGNYGGRTLESDDDVQFSVFSGGAAGSTPVFPIVKCLKLDDASGKGDDESCILSDGEGLFVKTIKPVDQTLLRQPLMASYGNKDKWQCTMGIKNVDMEYFYTEAGDPDEQSKDSSKLLSFKVRATGDATSTSIPNGGTETNAGNKSGNKDWYDEGITDLEDAKKTDHGMITMRGDNNFARCTHDAAKTPGWNRLISCGYTKYYSNPAHNHDWFVRKNCPAERSGGAYKNKNYSAIGGMFFADGSASDAKIRDGSMRVALGLIDHPTNANIMGYYGGVVGVSWLPSNDLMSCGSRDVSIGSKYGNYGCLRSDLTNLNTSSRSYSITLKHADKVDISVKQLGEHKGAIKAAPGDTSTKGACSVTVKCSDGNTTAGTVAMSEWLEDWKTAVSGCKGSYTVTINNDFNISSWNEGDDEYRKKHRISTNAQQESSGDDDPDNTLPWRAKAPAGEGNVMYIPNILWCISDGLRYGCSDATEDDAPDRVKEENEIDDWANKNNDGKINTYVLAPGGNEIEDSKGYNNYRWSFKHDKLDLLYDTFQDNRRYCGVGLAVSVTPNEVAYCEHGYGYKCRDDDIRYVIESVCDKKYSTVSDYKDCYRNEMKSRCFKAPSETAATEVAACRMGIGDETYNVYGTKSATASYAGISTTFSGLVLFVGKMVLGSDGLMKFEGKKISGESGSGATITSVSTAFNSATPAVTGDVYPTLLTKKDCDDLISGVRLKFSSTVTKNLSTLTDFSFAGTSDSPDNQSKYYTIPKAFDRTKTYSSDIPYRASCYDYIDETASVGSVDSPNLSNRPFGAYDENYKRLCVEGTTTPCTPFDPKTTKMMFAGRAVEQPVSGHKTSPLAISSVQYSKMKAPESLDVFASIMKDKSRGTPGGNWRDGFSEAYNVSFGNVGMAMDGSHLLMYIRSVDENRNPSPGDDPNKLFKGNSDLDLVFNTVSKDAGVMLFTEKDLMTGSADGMIEMRAPKTGIPYFKIVDISKADVVGQGYSGTETNSYLFYNTIGSGDGKYISFYGDEVSDKVTYEKTNGSITKANFRDYNSGYYDIKFKYEKNSVGWLGTAQQKLSGPIKNLFFGPPSIVSRTCLAKGLGSLTVADTDNNIIKSDLSSPTKYSDFTDCAVSGNSNAASAPSSGWMPGLFGVGNSATYSCTGDNCTIAGETIKQPTTLQFYKNCLEATSLTGKKKCDIYTIPRNGVNKLPDSTRLYLSEEAILFTVFEYEMNPTTNSPLILPNVNNAKYDFDIYDDGTTVNRPTSLADFSTSSTKDFSKLRVYFGCQPLQKFMQCIVDSDCSNGGQCVNQRCSCNANNGLCGTGQQCVDQKCVIPNDNRSCKVLKLQPHILESREDPVTKVITYGPKIKPEWQYLFREGKVVDPTNVKTAVPRVVEAEVSNHVSDYMLANDVVLNGMKSDQLRATCTPIANTTKDLKNVNTSLTETIVNKEAQANALALLGALDSGQKYCQLRGRVELPTNNFSIEGDLLKLDKIQERLITYFNNTQDDWNNYSKYPDLKIVISMEDITVKEGSDELAKSLLNDGSTVLPDPTKPENTSNNRPIDRGFNGKCVLFFKSADVVGASPPLYCDKSNKITMGPDKIYESIKYTFDLPDSNIFATPCEEAYRYNTNPNCPAYDQAAGSGATSPVLTTKTSTSPSICKRSGHPFVNDYIRDGDCTDDNGTSCKQIVDASTGCSLMQFVYQHRAGCNDRSDILLSARNPFFFNWCNKNVTHSDSLPNTWPKTYYEDNSAVGSKDVREAMKNVTLILTYSILTKVPATTACPAVAGGNTAITYNPATNIEIDQIPKMSCQNAYFDKSGKHLMGNASDQALPSFYKCQRTVGDVYDDNNNLLADADWTCFKKVLKSALTAEGLKDCLTPLEAVYGKDGYSYYLRYKNKLDDGSCFYDNVSIDKEYSTTDITGMMVNQGGMFPDQVAEADFYNVSCSTTGSGATATTTCTYADNKCVADLPTVTERKIDIKSLITDSSPAVTSTATQADSQEVCYYTDRDWEQGFVYKVFSGIVNNWSYVTLYYLIVIFVVAYFGARMLLGLEEMKTQVLLGKLFTFAFIFAFTSPQGWDYYSYFVVQTFVKTGDVLTALIVSSSYNYEIDSLSMSDVAAGAFGPAEQAIGFIFSKNTMVRLLGLIFSEVFGWFFFCAILWSVVMFLVVSLKAIVIYIGVLITMAILLAIGPLCIICVAFSATKDVFKKWYQGLFSLILQQVLMFTVVFIFGTIFYGIVTGLLNYKVCMRTIVYLPIVNVPLISTWQVASSLPSHMKTFDMAQNPGDYATADGFPGIFGTFALIAIVMSFQQFLDWATKTAGALTDGGAASIAEGMGAPVNSALSKVADASTSMAKSGAMAPINASRAAIAKGADKITDKASQVVGKYGGMAASKAFGGAKGLVSKIRGKAQDKQLPKHGENIAHNQNNITKALDSAYRGAFNSKMKELDKGTETKGWNKSQKEDVAKQHGMQAMRAKANQMKQLDGKNGNLVLEDAKRQHYEQNYQPFSVHAEKKMLQNAADIAAKNPTLSANAVNAKAKAQVIDGLDGKKLDQFTGKAGAANGVARDAMAQNGNDVAKALQSLGMDGAVSDAAIKSAKETLENGGKKSDAASVMQHLAANNKDVRSAINNKAASDKVASDVKDTLDKQYGGNARAMVNDFNKQYGTQIDADKAEKAMAEGGIEKMMNNKEVPGFAEAAKANSFEQMSKSHGGAQDRVAMNLRNAHKQQANNFKEGYNREQQNAKAGAAAVDMVKDKQMLEAVTGKSMDTMAFDAMAKNGGTAEKMAENFGMDAAAVKSAMDSVNAALPAGASELDKVKHLQQNNAQFNEKFADAVKKSAGDKQLNENHKGKSGNQILQELGKKVDPNFDAKAAAVAISEKRGADFLSNSKTSAAEVMKALEEVGQDKMANTARGAALYNKVEAKMGTKLKDDIYGATQAMMFNAGGGASVAEKNYKAMGVEGQKNREEELLKGIAANANKDLVKNNAPAATPSSGASPSGGRAFTPVSGGGASRSSGGGSSGGSTPPAPPAPPSGGSTGGGAPSASGAAAGPIVGGSGSSGSGAARMVQDASTSTAANSSPASGVPVPEVAKKKVQFNIPGEGISSPGGSNAGQAQGDPSRDSVGDIPLSARSTGGTQGAVSSAQGQAVLVTPAQGNVNNSPMPTQQLSDEGGIPLSARPVGGNGGGNVSPVPSNSGVMQGSNKGPMPTLAKSMAASSGNQSKQSASFSPMPDRDDTPPRAPSSGASPSGSGASPQRTNINAASGSRSSGGFDGATSAYTATQPTMPQTPPPMPAAPVAKQPVTPANKPIGGQSGQAQGTFKGPMPTSKPSGTKQQARTSGSPTQATPQKTNNDDEDGSNDDENDDGSSGSNTPPPAPPASPAAQTPPAPPKAAGSKPSNAKTNQGGGGVSSALSNEAGQGIFDMITKLLD